MGAARTGTDMVWRLGGLMGGHRAMESWATDSTFYGGSVWVRCRHDWPSARPPECVGAVFPTQSYRLTFDSNDPDRRDVHVHHYLCAGAVAQVRDDFVRVVGKAIKGRLPHALPHKGRVPRPVILDPHEDAEERRGRLPYAEVTPESGLGASCAVRIPTQEVSGRTFYDCTMYYDRRRVLVGADYCVSKPGLWMHVMLRMRGGRLAVTGSRAL